MGEGQEQGGGRKGRVQSCSSVKFCGWYNRNMMHIVNKSHSLAKPHSCFSCDSLALQDYNNKAPDDEPAPVPRLDIGCTFF